MKNYIESLIRDCKWSLGEIEVTKMKLSDRIRLEQILVKLEIILQLMNKFNL